MRPCIAFYERGLFLFCFAGDVGSLKTQISQKYKTQISGEKKEKKEPHL